jgi:ribosomal protein S18 acetylase RimI-like enzyme
VVQLYVTASNARALAFYRHEGFRETQAIMHKVLIHEASGQLTNRNGGR